MFGSVPETNFALDLTPVDRMSASIVELGESKETLNETISFSPTHRVTFTAIWSEICRQRQLEPYYLEQKSIFLDAFVIPLNPTIEEYIHLLGMNCIISFSILNYFTWDFYVQSCF